ncbi:TRAP transporter large permease subunit, partial [Streptococcus salivarius]|uniref:TRAP transporter large permease subunit n=1 Tax=Streptococcus salivarius TaxID=1304 RepID=UPI001D06C239|nr:TRAP transporter large permease subunit [Streptococcus salivarius]
MASSCQGLIIPPSHNMVLYSMVAGGVSVGSLFCAGYIPGIMLGLSRYNGIPFVLVIMGVLVGLYHFITSKTVA